MVLSTIFHFFIFPAVLNTVQRARQRSRPASTATEARVEPRHSPAAGQRELLRRFARVHRLARGPRFGK